MQKIYENILRAINVLETKIFFGCLYIPDLTALREIFS